MRSGVVDASEGKQSTEYASYVIETNIMTGGSDGLVSLLKSASSAPVISASSVVVSDLLPSFEKRFK